MVRPTVQVAGLRAVRVIVPCECNGRFVQYRPVGRVPDFSPCTLKPRNASPCVTGSATPRSRNHEIPYEADPRHRPRRAGRGRRAHRLRRARGRPDGAAAARGRGRDRYPRRPAARSRLHGSCGGLARGRGTRAGERHPAPAPLRGRQRGAQRRRAVPIDPDRIAPPSSRPVRSSVSSRRGSRRRAGSASASCRWWSAVSSASASSTRPSRLSKWREANTAAAQARLRTAELDLAYTEVRAPIAGLTSREVRSEGSLAIAGDDSSLLTRIVQTDPIYVEFSLPRTRGRAGARTARRGSCSRPSASGSTDGTEHPQAAELTFIDNAVEAGSGTVRARAVLPNPERRAGARAVPARAARGRVVPGAVVVPRRAVMIERPGQLRVARGRGRRGGAAARAARPRGRRRGGDRRGTRPAASAWSWRACSRCSPGAKVTIAAPAATSAAPAAGAAAEAEASAVISRFFIDRPIFASVISASS